VSGPTGEWSWMPGLGESSRIALEVAWGNVPVDGRIEWLWIRCHASCLVMIFEGGVGSASSRRIRCTSCTHPAA